MMPFNRSPWISCRGLLAFFAFTAAACGGPEDIMASQYDELRAPQNDMGTGADASNALVGAATPAVLSGTGRLQKQDTDDFYSVDVAVGQTLFVTMAPPSAANFDLELLSASGMVLATSNLGAGLSESASTQATVDGNIVIHVSRVAGSGTYSLAIQLTSPTQNDMQTGGDAPATTTGAPVLQVLSGTGELTDTDAIDCFKVPMLIGQTGRVLIGLDSGTTYLDSNGFGTGSITWVSEGLTHYSNCAARPGQYCGDSFSTDGFPGQPGQPSDVVLCYARTSPGVGKYSMAITITTP